MLLPSFKITITWRRKLNIARIIKTIRFCRIFPVIVITLLFAGCGTFQLSSGAVPLSPKSQDQMQLDNLSCKDQAKIEANTAERQAGAFLLGFTIVGAPLAFELEKSKQREVYKSCMEARGYRVLPPKDGVEATATSKSNLPVALLPNPPTQPVRPVSTAIVRTVQIPSAAPGRDEAAQLQKLKELRDKGLITADEYETKRKEAIDRL